MKLVCLIALVGLSAAASRGGVEDLVDSAAQPEVFGVGYGFCEGPAADGAGRIFFSDGKNNRIHLYTPGRAVEVFVDDSFDANGMMFNSNGELVVCEGAAYRIVAFDITTRQKRIVVGGGPQREYNEPNDLAIDRHGGIYFTDPNYRHRGQEPIRKENTYYAAPDGSVRCVSTVCKKPNGIVLTPDNRVLYLADNGGRCVYRYDVVAPGVLTNETNWADLGAGPDGMTLDEHGHLYIACGGAGVKVYAPDGTEKGVLLPGVYASNVVFGGADFRTLFITSRDKFLGLAMKVRGVASLAPPP